MSHSERDRKITSKQEEEEAEATFRLEVSYRLRFRGRVPRKKVFKNIFFKKKYHLHCGQIFIFEAARAAEG